MFANAHFLERAIQLAQRAENPSPNPRVGAVIVQNEKIVAEGWHERAGQPHAEIVALQKAGARATGATLFVTLEPCNHFGKTPPCAAAVKKSGIAKVVIGMPDPSKKASGGANFLKEAGINVQFAGKKIAQSCRELNQSWLKGLQSPFPFVTLKLAIDRSGSTIPPPGKKWITGAASRKKVHEMRAQHDAILVGINTVLADDPRLTVRGIKVEHQPVRIILDPHGRLPKTARLLKEPGTTIVVTKKPVKMPYAKNLVAARFQLPMILKELKKRGITSVFVEGGATTARYFLEADLVDQIYLFQANPQQNKPQLFGQQFPMRNIKKSELKDDVLWQIPLHSY